MTELADMQRVLADVRERLLAPGGAFEVVEEEVRGIRLPVFRNRRRSFHELLVESAAHGEREYLVDGTRRVSYAEHLGLVASLAIELRDRYGVGKGDRVAIFAGNCADWVISFWAATCLGAIAVGYNAWWSRREVAYALEHSSPSVVIADAKRAALIDPASTAAVVLSIERDLPALESAHIDAALPIVDLAEDDPAVIVYTSGTTGYPKGALHSLRNLMAVLDYHRLGDAVAETFGPRTSPRRVLMSLPLFHIASLHNLAFPRLVAGDTVVIDTGKFDIDRVLRLIERERITNWAIVPTMAHRLVNANLSAYDLSSLAALSINSAPSSVLLKDRIRAAVPSIQGTLIDSYGLTESSTAATVATTLDLAQYPTTVGRPVATVSIEIRDENNRAVGEGEDGEICLRSAFNMIGYWGDDEATSATFDIDGWMHTGDIGFLRDGLLFMSTRRSDLILRGGENVYPAEIEAVLDEHPDVIECSVFGVAHPDLGEEVAAVVVTGPNPPPEDSLRAFVAERLAYYKVPSRWRFTSTPLPRTATGKVVRASVTI
ncbi:MAG TPA: class I adenylate-forming enzyme family protein [Jatrophihabitantaceae bacterium]|nr:class I adenylate-forming enzyme family protein [Jatrophihabitantaceae bacterium]